MIKTKNIIFIMLPAIAFAGFVLFLGFSQYKPIYEKQDAKKENADFVPILTDDLIIGQKKAGKTIITFEDLGCPRCREQLNFFNQLTELYPNDVKVIVKLINITTFPTPSNNIHSYSYCAGKQNKFTEFEKEALNDENAGLDLDSIKNYTSLAKLDKIELEKCLNSEEQKQYSEKNEQIAKALQIQNVPTTFINNKVIQEPLTLDGWKSLLSIP